MNKSQKIVPILSQIIEILLIILIFTIPFPSHRQGIETICFVFIVLLFIAKLTLDRRKRYIKKSSIDLPILIFTGLVILSIFFSINLLHSLSAFKEYWLKPIFLFYIMVNFADKQKKFRNLTLAIFISLLISMIIGILKFPFSEYLLGNKRLDSLITGPNEFAEYLEMFVPILLAFMLWSRKNYLKIGAGVFLLINIFCLLFTYSRGSWIAIFPVSSFLFFKKDKRLILLPILLVIIFFVVSTPALKQRIFSAINIEKIPSTDNRIRIWRETIGEIKKRPLTGFGWGWKNYRQLAPQFRSEKMGWHAHNYFLEIAFESGIPASCVFLWLWITIMIKSWRIYAKVKDDFLKTLTIGIWGAFLVKFIHWFVDVPISIEIILTMWALVGIVMAIEANMLEKCKCNT